MEIIVGKTSGFCEGVSYTVKKAYETLNSTDAKVYCLGEIVHNESVVQDLTSRGMVFVSSIDELPNKATVIIRAHGTTCDNYKLLEAKSTKIIDLTCGKIRAIRNKILKENDSFIIIIGKKAHPETIGTFSFCKEGDIVESESDLIATKEKFFKSNKNKVYVVSQTTFNEEEFYFLTNKIKEEFINYDVIIDNTICDATKKRQDETRELSKNVDCMLIVGGKNSSNTKELYNVAIENCKDTFLIQDTKDLIDFTIDFRAKKVGIMAGASTPDHVVDEVIHYLKNRGI